MNGVIQINIIAQLPLSINAEFGPESGKTARKRGKNRGKLKKIEKCDALIPSETNLKETQYFVVKTVTNG